MLGLHSFKFLIIRLLRQDVSVANDAIGPDFDGTIVGGLSFSQDEVAIHSTPFTNSRIGGWAST